MFAISWSSDEDIGFCIKTFRSHSVTAEWYDLCPKYWLSIINLNCTINQCTSAKTKTKQKQMKQTKQNKFFPKLSILQNYILHLKVYCKLEWIEYY